MNEHVGAACCLVVYDGKEFYAVPTEPYQHHPIEGFNYHVESRNLYDRDRTEPRFPLPLP